MTFPLTNALLEEVSPMSSIGTAELEDVSDMSSKPLFVSPLTNCISVVGTLIQMVGFIIDLE